MKRDGRGRVRLELRPLDRNVFDGETTVGYWDGNTGDPGRDFRSLGSRPTRALADDFRLEVLVRDPRYR